MRALVQAVERRVARAAGAILVALAAVLPFEARVGHVGPLDLTTVEAVLYATLALWGLALALRCARDRRGLLRAFARSSRAPLLRAATLWVVVVFVTAAVAPLDRAASLKFALRTLSGVLLFLATCTLARSRVTATRVVLALVVGALISASAALLEAWVPASHALFTPFRGMSFDASGLRRASGVFVYPTIGAMYWEASAPLVLAASFALRGRQRAKLAWIGTALAVGVLGAAILASATRSAMAGTVVACIVVAVTARGWGRPLSRRAGVALLALVVTFGLAVVPRPGSRLAERLQFWDDDRWFGVTYDLPRAPGSVAADGSVTTPLTLHNTGKVAWTSQGERATRLACHWYAVSPEGVQTLLTWNGDRTTLPTDVPPGGQVTLVAVARAPVGAGTYRLAWDLVEEDVAWYSERGNATADEIVVVGDDTPPVERPLAPGPAPIGGPLPPGRRALWGAAVTLWRARPLLGIGPDNFRRRYEAVLSRPGDVFTDTRTHANSLYFETLADMGVLGLVALAGLMGAWLAALVRVARARSVLGLGVAVATGTFFVHGVSDYFLEFTPTYALFWMLLGVLRARADAIAPAAWTLRRLEERS